MRGFEAFSASEPGKANESRGRLPGHGGIFARTGSALGLLAAVAVIALPASAMAAGETSNYTTAPAVTTHSAPPSNEVKPEKESGEPTKAVAPTSEASTPASTPAAKSTLPFTGLNLAWMIGAGVLLLGFGVSIRLAQRRHG
ncbi:MAG: hypothetical protein ACYDA6_05340 [Solirubrobacteraceae bacterium]